MLNVLFGVAYRLETPFFPHLTAPNLAPKTALFRTCPGRSESLLLDRVFPGMADERMKAAPVLPAVSLVGMGTKQSIEYPLANFTHDHSSARRAGCQ
jgi:hypothetical protein